MQILFAFKDQKHNYKLLKRGKTLIDLHMKKELILMFFLITWTTLNSQNKVSNYIQFSVGYNPSYSYASSSHDKSLYFLSGEYGKQYKWLDLGISLDYENGLNPFWSLNYFGLTHIKQTNSYTLHSENSFSGIVNAALRLNLRINIIKLLSETSKHSLKIGGNYGVGFTEEINSHDETNDNISWWYNSSYNWYGGYRFSYEYDLTSNISIGAFYNKGIIGTYGVSILRKF